MISTHYAAESAEPEVSGRCSAAPRGYPHHVHTHDVGLCEYLGALVAVVACAVRPVWGIGPVLQGDLGGELARLMTQKMINSFRWGRATPVPDLPGETIPGRRGERSCGREYGTAPFGKHQCQVVCGQVVYGITS